MIPDEKSLPPLASDGLATRLFDCALRLYFHLLSSLGELTWAEDGEPIRVISVVDRRRAG